MTDRGVVICGPSSSGNHLAAELVRQVLAMDVVWRFDDPEYRKAYDEDKYILWGALPCKGDWDWIHGALYRLTKLQKSLLVVPVRDFAAMAKSQVNHHHVPDMATAYRDIVRAYGAIITSAESHGLPFYFLSYEAIMHDRDMAWWGLALALCVDAPLFTTPLANANPARWEEIQSGEFGPNGYTL